MVEMKNENFCFNMANPVSRFADLVYEPFAEDRHGGAERKA